MEILEMNCRFEVYDNKELSMFDIELIEKAKEAAMKAYAPYSEFQVGASARLEDGTIVCGNNQENAAYPSGLCAERTTIFYANAAFPDLAIVEIAIAAYAHGKFLSSPIPPCGACRQVMLEAESRYGHPIRLLLYGERLTYISPTAKQLLPLQFINETMQD